MDTTEDMQMRLYSSRVRLKREMQRALSCISPGGKRLLVKEWQEKYSKVIYDELLRCAKNRSAMETIANWNIEEMK
jgi:hypothetical protein